MTYLPERVKRLFRPNQSQCSVETVERRINTSDLGTKKGFVMILVSHPHTNTPTNNTTFLSEVILKKH